jgi:uncharacterized protein
VRTNVALIVLGLHAAALHAQQPPPPIIDMHLHAARASSNGPPPTALCLPFTEIPTHDPATSWAQGFGKQLKNPRCADAIWGPATDEAVLSETIAVLERRNIVALTSGPAALLEQWQKAAPERIKPALGFRFQQRSVPSAAEVRQWFQEKRYAAFAEVTIQYDGISPSDPQFEPYLAAAEETDVPMGIHIGTGPPGAPYLPGSPQYRARLHSPLVLEDALVRHPKLRVYIMHAGWPMLDDLLAVMWAHPQVYVDVGVISAVLPRAEFHRYLQRIVEAGFGKRVMFGSDQMNWPAMIERALEGIEGAAFLSAAQKRDILFHNAARFLRMSDDEIARWHRKAR